MSTKRSEEHTSELQSLLPYTTLFRSLPARAGCERGAGDVLDAFHQADQPLVAVGSRRREADAAVAEDERRDAVPRRRRELGVPRRLRVVVRVDVDEEIGRAHV